MFGGKVGDFDGKNVAEVRIKLELEEENGESPLNRTYKIVEQKADYKDTDAKDKSRKKFVNSLFKTK